MEKCNLSSDLCGYSIILKAMKFLESEHKAIKAAIEASPLPYEAFTFVKRRGRLHIQFGKQQPVFTFHRKKETKLNDQLKWDETTTYELGMAANRQTVTTWEDVMEAFSSWLDEIQ